MNVRRLLVGLAVLAATAALVSRSQCVASSATSTLNQSLPSNPATLNNLLRSENRARGLCETYLAPPLLTLDPDTLEPKPQLAAAMPEISADHLVYTWTIRADARWEDGTPVTTKDVELPYRFAMDPSCKADAVRALLQDVKSIEVVDAHTFRVTQGTPYFRALIEFGTNFRLLPAHRLADVKPADLERHEIGHQPLSYGPYRLKSWETDREIVFVRNDSYFGPKPAIDVVRFRINKDDSANLRLLRQGQIDLATLSADDWKKCAADADFGRTFQTFSYYLPQVYFFAWNCSKPLFADARVRRALSHAIRRKEIVDTVLEGHGQVGVSPFGPMDPSFAGDIQPQAFDLDAAKKLLADVGWKDSNGDGILDKDGQKFAFTMIYSPTAALHSAILTSFKSDLEKIGVVCEILPVDWNPYTARLKVRDFDACFALWAGQSADEDPSRLLRSSYAKNGQNYACYENAHVDQLLDRAKTEFDRTTRIATYHELQQILNDEQPFSFLVVPEILVAVSRRFANVKLHKIGMRTIEWTVASD
ncbi:MAG: hypothetical protein HYR85_27360 [Planctomycetes bacterium]|nr:hypothetical protein [Planctomycetota bacterium]MBI3848372.1 hypothetical protein [Planctomycetota bacterium]